MLSGGFIGRGACCEERRKPPHTQCLKLRDFGDVGLELQLYVDDEFASGRRYETRALALIDADERRERLLKQGWTAHTTKAPGGRRITSSRAARDRQDEVAAGAL